jgi:hypothetical protein
MDHPLSDASVYLVGLARRIGATYGALPDARGVLLVGSAALGVSDRFSDLDMSVYYEALPSDEALAAARAQNGGGEIVWQMGERAEGGFAQAYVVNGIECQIGHITVEAWERDIATVVEGHDVTTPLHKAMEGLLYGLPLYGEGLIGGWKERVARFPQGLAEAMVRHYLSFFPIWYLRERFESRDATLWYYGILVEAGQHLLGVLAGLNRRYYSTFQFKRMRRFVEELPLAPHDLASRLDAVFTLPREQAIDGIEALVAETVALVEQEMPQVDTSKVRRRLGQRQGRWALPEV